MCPIFKQSFLKTIILYQGVSGIVLGILGLSYAGHMMVNLSQVSRHVIYTNDIFFYHFLLWVSLSSVLKGFLVLMAALRENKILLVVYLIWTTLVLVLGKTFVVRAGIQMKNEIEKMRQTKDPYIVLHYERSFAYFFYVYYPLIFAIGWFLQFCAVLFFVNLVRGSKAEPGVKEEELHLPEIKSEMEIA